MLLHGAVVDGSFSCDGKLATPMPAKEAWLSVLEYQSAVCPNSDAKRVRPSAEPNIVLIVA